MNFFRRLLAAFLVVALLPCPLVRADEASEWTRIPFQPNHLYEDVLGGTAFAHETDPADVPQTFAWPRYQSEADAAVTVREYMKERSDSFVVYVNTDRTDYEALFNDLIDAAVVHTGAPAEGDYLLWHYAGASGGYQNTLLGVKFTFAPDYYTTAQQEEEMDAAVEQLLEQLALEGKTNYQKVCAIYDYICENITYDYDNLEDESYDLKFSAYAALINKTAVCQGYASLFYRLALESGVDARLIPGTSSGGNHGWNIVRLGDIYYNLDATWDAVYAQNDLDYRYFLRCPENFTDHVREASYDDAGFHALYPMAQSDFAGNCADLGYHTGGTQLRGAVAPTCTEAGYSGDTYCLGCGEKTATGAAVNKLPHTLTHHAAVAATCVSGGCTEYWSCGTCDGRFADKDGNTILSTIATAADPDNHTGGTQLRGAVAPTCTAGGYTGDTHCLSCGGLLSTGFPLEKLPHTTTHHAAVPATCVSGGCTEYWSCSTCDGRFADKDGNTTLSTIATAVNPGNHTGGTELRDAAAPTCTEAGYSGDTYCLGCGEKTATGAAVDKLPHTLTHHAAVAATCAAGGNVEYWACDGCDKYYADKNGTTALASISTEKNASNHTGGTEARNAVSPSCTEDGYTGDTHCLGCGHKLSSGSAVAALGHAYDFKEKCTRCGHSNAKPPVNRFVDVSASQYYYAPVLWAVEKGITNGIDDTHFGPDVGCTRGHVVTFLWRAAGSPEPGTAGNPFTDVPESQYYRKAVLWAVENGITKGTGGGLFQPDTTCTRGQIVTFLWRFRNGSEPLSGGSFSDVPADAYYADAVAWAVENGITKGMGNGLFQPDATCTRGQIVTFLYRTAN